MKNFNKIMGSLNATVKKLELLSAKNRVAKNAKQDEIKKIEQHVKDISAEEIAAKEVAEKLKALFMPTNAQKLKGV